MSRLVRLLFLSICAALARPGLAEHEKHKHSSRWHTDWLVVVHHYNESLKWLEDLPFHHHVKVGVYIQQDKLVSHKCSSAIPHSIRSHVAFCKEGPVTLGEMSHTIASFLAEHYHHLPRITYFARDTCAQQRASCRILDLANPEMDSRDFAEFTNRARDMFQRERWPPEPSPSTWTDHHPLEPQMPNGPRADHPHSCPPANPHSWCQVEDAPFTDDSCLCAPVIEDFEECPDFLKPPEGCYGELWDQIVELWDYADRPLLKKHNKIRWPERSQFAIPATVVQRVPRVMLKMVEYLTDALGEHSHSEVGTWGIPSMQMLAPRPVKPEGAKVWSSSLEWSDTAERFWFGLFDNNYEKNLNGDPIYVPARPVAAAAAPQGAGAGAGAGAGGAGAGSAAQSKQALLEEMQPKEPPPGPPPPPMSSIGKAALDSLYSPGSWGGR